MIDKPLLDYINIITDELIYLVISAPPHFPDVSQLEVSNAPRDVGGWGLGDEQY
jgi:hypothetical protein